MTIKLCPCFEHWKKYNNIWLYSDPHFNDEDQVFLRPDYIGDDAQVKKINEKVGKKDIIIILGDIGNRDYIKSIRGYKVLIKGNHDTGASTYNSLFDEVYDGPVFISPKILLTHEPVAFPYGLNIHGHDHNNSSFRDDKHINICAELINYSPISLLDIIKSGVLNKIDDIHRATINKASVK